MTDFYTVLRDSLTSLQVTDAAERAKLYDRVRAVMVRQLHARVPPLPVRDINDQIAKFDAAVERLDDELTHEAARAVADDVDWAVPSAGGLFGVAVPRSNVAFAGAAAGDGYPAAPWETPPIDMAWDEETEQWLDPSPDEDLPPVPRMAAAQSPLPEEREAAPRIVVSPPPESGLDTDFALDEGEERGWRLFRRRARHRDGVDAIPETDEAGDRNGRRAGLFATFGRRSRDEDDLPLEGEAPGARRTRASRASTPTLVPAEDDEDSPAGNGWLRRFAVAGLALVGLGLVGAAAFIITPRLLPAPTRPPAERVAALDPSLAPSLAPAPADPSPAEPPRVLRNFFPAPNAGSETIILYDGHNPTVFQAGPDNPVRYMQDGAGVARISSAAGTAGAKALIAPSVAQRLAGHRIRLVLEARSAAENGAARMRLAYQRGSAVSGWQEADLPVDFSEISLVWEMPADATAGNDYILIQPGIPGDGTATEVRSIRFEIVG